MKSFFKKVSISLKGLAIHEYINMPAGKLTLVAPSRTRSAVKIQRTFRRYRRRRTGSLRAPTFKSLRRMGGSYNSSQKFIRYCYKLMPWSYGDTGAGLSLAFGSLDFSLDDLPSPTEFENLFDSYAIAQVVLHISPHWNDGNCKEPTETSHYGPMMPYLGFVLDYDDAATPSNENTLYQYPGFKYWPIDRQYHIKLRPKVMNRISLQTGSGTVRESPTYGKLTWIDMADTDVAHNGFKYMIDNSASKQIPGLHEGPLIKVLCEYHILVKGIR